MEQTEVEKAAELVVGSYFRIRGSNSWNDALEIFKAGAEWQKEQSQKEIDKARAYIEDLSKGYEH